ncbi:MAG: class E sortase [Propionibacteriales bacterium]|nr:class E sortase [Propionibacteriales bacterium]
MNPVTAQTVSPEAPPPPPPARRRKPLLLVGLVLVLAGVGLLGYVAWEYWGTNIVSKNKQQDITNDLLNSWDDPAVGDLLGPSEGSDLGDALALVKIPRFGAEYVVPVIEGVRPEDLAQGLGHYPGTALPGQVGNFAVAGHRVTHGEPFRDLPKMREGDEVVVETADAVYTYEMDTDPNDLVVQPGDTWVIDPVPGEPKDTKPDQARITLTTCAELFHTSDRLVSFGHLVDTERKRG